MDTRRPTLVATRRNRNESAASSEEEAPNTQRKPTLFVDLDETRGLTHSIAQAQDLVSESAQLANEARDANDEELAEFFEHCQREAAERVHQAKGLLETRLRHEIGQRANAPPVAERGRVHYVSSPDEDPESVERR